MFLPQTEAEAKRKEVGGGGSGGSGGPPASEKKPSKRMRDREKDPNLPKRPQNPFFQFCKVGRN